MVDPWSRFVRGRAISSDLWGERDILRLVWGKRPLPICAEQAISSDLCGGRELRLVCTGKDSMCGVVIDLFRLVWARHFGFLRCSGTSASWMTVRAHDSTRLGACPHLELASPLTLITLGSSVGAPRFQHLMSSMASFDSMSSSSVSDASLGCIDGQIVGFCMPSRKGSSRCGVGPIWVL